MPLFSSSTPFDGDVEKATSEMNTTEDWGIIMDICDKIGRTPNGPKECLKSITKRLNHKIPHVSMQAVTLLDVCVNNCGRQFHLEVASRDFVSELRTLVNGKAHPRVAAELKQIIKKWSDNDFKSDPALDLIPSLYSSMLKDGVDFSASEQQPSTSQPTTAVAEQSNQQEQDDIAKAIALSLEEEKKKGGKTSSLYPSFSSTPSAASNNKSRELRKVRALYDFEAAEDNELTFKAGEIISILDDSDANWWKGVTWRGEGLFPANFCTADLSAEVEPEIVKEKKSVQFNEEVEVKEMPIEVMEIDEERIDKCLNMLQNADPTGETNPDPPEMLNLEEQCKSMGPLIDTELQKIDRKHNNLMELNTKVMDSLQMYHNLMKELPTYGYGPMPKLAQQPFVMPQVYDGQQLPAQMVPPAQVSMATAMPQSFSPPPPGVTTTVQQTYSDVVASSVVATPFTTQQLHDIPTYTPAEAPQQQPVFAQQQPLL